MKVGELKSEMGSRTGTKLKAIPAGPRIHPNEIRGSPTIRCRGGRAVNGGYGHVHIWRIYVLSPRKMADVIKSLPLCSRKGKQAKDQAKKWNFNVHNLGFSFSRISVPLTERSFTESGI